MTGAIRALMRQQRRFGLVVRVRASADEVALAGAVVDSSGVAVQAERLLKDARVNGAGRPRVLPVRTLLVALLTLALAGQPLHLRRAYELLVHLPAPTRRRLQVQRPDGRLVTERQVAYLFGRLCRLLDHSPHTAADVDQATRDARRGRLQELMDDLLAATLPEQRASGSYALDATTVPAWARGWRSHARRRDHDAGWSVKRPDGSTDLDATTGGDTRPRKGRKVANFVFGYETHLLTWVRDDGQPTGTLPALTERIVVFGGGKSDIDVVTDTITDMLAGPAATQPSGDLLADRWYTQQRAGRFALRVRRAGAQLVMDLKAAEEGPRGHHRGALRVDGDLYCPAMPAGLHQLPSAHYKHLPQVHARQAVAAQRDPYRLVAHGRPDDDGFQRLTCPAERNRIRCPLKPASLERSQADLPTVLTPPTAPGACCTQKTIKVAPAVDAGNRQKHPWGSAAWRASYDRRNVVEGAAGYLKTAGGGDVKRDHIRVMGIVAHSLLMAVAVAAMNLQLHAKHLHRLDTQADTDATGDTTGASRPDGYDDVIAATAAQVAREKHRKAAADPPAA